MTTNTKSWYFTEDKVSWTDGFGREFARPSLALFLDAGRQYAVVRNPLAFPSNPQPFLIIDCEAGREI